MPFVRKRGDQLAIVHGVRHAGSANVEQQLLFTLYSKPEALAALGRPDPSDRHRFEALLEHAHPGLRFDWKKLRRDIENNLDVLPEEHDYDATRLHDRFGGALAAFAKELALAEPYGLTSSARLIKEHRRELEYLRDLIDWRLQAPERSDSEWGKDNAFLWRFACRGTDVPPEVEEQAADWYEKLEYEKAATAFKVLTAAFDDYAEGYNYLGLIALHQQRWDEAIGYFKKTMETGRRHFPKKIAKGRWWSDLNTRPYMRGLMNLALAFNQAGRYDEALGACEQLEHECHEQVEAAAHRAVAYLNMKRWAEALEAEQSTHSERVVAALAAFELGKLDEARAYFLHAALRRPRTVAMLVGGIVTGRPVNRAATEDHNGGVMLVRSLAGYLSKRRPVARRFFAELWKDERVVRYRRELERVTQEWREDRQNQNRAAYDRMQQLQTWGFARQVMMPAATGSGGMAKHAPRGARGGLHLVH
jgi:tetratricopeptide (TPR) repeat protein